MYIWYTPNHICCIRTNTVTENLKTCHFPDYMKKLDQNSEHFEWIRRNVHGEKKKAIPTCFNKVKVIRYLLNKKERQCSNNEKLYYEFKRLLLISTTLLDHLKLWKKKYHIQLSFKLNKLSPPTFAKTYWHIPKILVSDKKKIHVISTLLVGDKFVDHECNIKEQLLQHPRWSALW